MEVLDGTPRPTPQSPAFRAALGPLNQTGAHTNDSVLLPTSASSSSVREEDTPPADDADAAAADPNVGTLAPGDGAPDAKSCESGC